MVAKAEELRDQYYLIKMTPRPKVAKKVFAEVPVPEESKAEENLDLGDEDEKVP